LYPSPVGGQNMCGRFSLTASAELLRTFFYLLEGAPLLEPRFNIAPSQEVAAIRCDASLRRSLAPLRWGLIPSWSNKASSTLINARAETLAQKPAFRTSFKKRRCQPAPLLYW
jgi:putative SOS response-associated peptidase YedK